MHPDSYFRETIFTYNNAETIESVAAHFADGGAVESCSWEFLKETNPALVEQTRVMHASPTFGFPPIVAHSDVQPDLKLKMAATLIGIKDDPGRRQLLNTLHLDGFGAFYRHMCDGIRLMAAEMRNVTSVTMISKTAGVSELQ